MTVRLHMDVDGLDGMENDFRHAASPEPYHYARERLDSVLRDVFEETQAVVPVGTGDYRRPAGALRDSGRTSASYDDEVWSGEIAYGTNDDALPYAVWARWKHLRKSGVDYMEPTNTDRFVEALNAAFDDAFGVGHGE